MCYENHAAAAYGTDACISDPSHNYLQPIHLRSFEPRRPIQLDFADPLPDNAESYAYPQR